MQRLAVLLLLPILAASGPSYREALPGYDFSFPRDHFDHPEFRTEWWYYTGNVWSKAGRRFGFEIVFFREGNPVGSRDNPSTWRIDDLYLAHAAVTDPNGRRFHWEERLNRSGPGIAGANFSARRIWNGNWSDAWTGEQQTVNVTAPEFSFHLDCVPVKPLVIQGENGVSQKAEGLGRASYYVSFPRLRTAGTLRVGGEVLAVSGQAWMDHEWFTHQLTADQIGWDWFSVQLANNTELMLFQLRRRDGSIDPFSAGTFIGADGRSHHLTASQFSLRPVTRWHQYPVEWAIAIPSLSVNLKCRAILPDQLVASTRGAKYWEGAVDYSGSENGYGYLEMTGYEAPMRLR